MRSLLRPALSAVLLAGALVLHACNRGEEPAEQPTAPAPGDAEAPAAVAPTPTTPAPAADAAPELPARRFLLVQGKVTVDGKVVKEGDAFSPMATIQVAKKTGRAVITLAPGTFVELRAGTRVTLTSSERKSTSLKLLAGTIWSFVARESSYEVVTGNAVAGVRGTVFYVEAKRKETFVCDCDGKLEIHPGGPAVLPRNVDSDKGHVPTLIKGRGKTAVVTSPRTKPGKPRGHTEAQAKDLLDLFEKAGGFHR